MRRIASVALLIGLIAVGCGGDDSKRAAAASARLLDPASELTIAVDMDYGDGAWQQIKRLYARLVREDEINFGDAPTPPTLDGALSLAASAAGLSFTDDVRPVLRGTLLVGVNVEPAAALSAESRRILERVDRTRSRYPRGGGEIFYDREGQRIRDVSRRRIERALIEQADHDPKFEFTAVFRTADPDALGRLLAKLRDQGVEPQPLAGVKGAQRLRKGIALVGKDTLVLALGRDSDFSDRLLRERLSAGGKGPAIAPLGDDFLTMRAMPGLLGAWLDRDGLRRALASAPGRALRGAVARLRLEEDAARANARVDFDGLAADALPLPGPGALALPRGEGIASASTNQSVTTVFLARLARQLWPDSLFVRRVEQLERRQGVRFEDAILRQFSGPSFTITRPRRDGGTDFAARSSLRDPAAMRALLPRLAPALPGILEGLQGLGSTGLVGLLLVAPDAPLTPHALALLAQARVLSSGGLFELRGLRGPGPDRVFYGVIGDSFVVASSRALAEEVAGMPSAPAPKAGTRLHVDVARALRTADPDNARELRALAQTIGAAASAQGGDIVAEATVKWAR
jgi:hypothetical protein